MRCCLPGYLCIPRVQKYPVHAAAYGPRPALEMKVTCRSYRSRGTDQQSRALARARERERKSAREREQRRYIQNRKRKAKKEKGRKRFYKVIIHGAKDIHCYLIYLIFIHGYAWRGRKRMEDG